MAGVVRVLEVGGTHVTAATVDTRRRQVRERTRHGLDSAATAPVILESLRSAAMELADTLPSPWAVAMPDPFDYPRGVALFRDVGKFDALYGVDVGQALSDSITPHPRSLTFVHDTEAFLVGEWLCGAARGAGRCAAVTVGTGIGSAFLDDGRTVRDGPGLPPGGRVHRVEVDGVALETAVSRRAIRARYAERSGQADDLDVDEICEHARRGDAIAVAVVTEAFMVLGTALAPAMIGFAPDVLVVGGSVARSWDLLERPLVEGLRRAGVRTLEVRPAARAADAAVIGAACSAQVSSPASRRTRRADATRAAFERDLAADDLVDRLVDYYAPDSPACGTNFLDGTECCAPDTITGADLFAVCALGLEVPPPTARRLLRDTHHLAAIARCLELLAPDLVLEETAPDTLRAMRALHDAVVAATAGDAVLAGAICARKRPELFPLLDPRTRRHLHLDGASVPDTWRAWREVLRTARLRADLAAAFAAVSRRGIVVDVHPLRQLQVVADTSAAID